MVIVAKVVASICK